MRNYYEQLYAKKLDNLGGMDKSLETESSKSYQEESENLNRLTENKEIEAANKKLQ